MKKRALSFLLAFAMLIAFAACGKDEAITPPESQTQLTSEPDPSPVTSDLLKNGRSIYGERTDNCDTLTGLEPLPEVKLEVKDDENSCKLSTAANSHSFGVSKDGVPNDIAVNNQKIYEKYGGYCLIDDGNKSVYLTFDCGYENGYTKGILDTLRQKKVPAAFFVTLDYVDTAPEMVNTMIRDGHIVGNHSDSHPDFAKISRTKMAQEIENLDNALRTRFGYSSPYFRFPAGSYNESALELVQSVGYTSVFWSSAYADWDPNVQKGKKYAFDTVTSRLHPGCVLLLHAVSPDNAAALGDIIDFARNEGYVFKALP